MSSSVARSEGRLIVVGGGIGGMAFALQAAQRGFGVEIVEADPQWRVYGAGISLTGPTYRAMKRLGILDEVRAKGFFINHGAAICAPDGSVVAEVPMHPLEPDLPTAGGIRRPDLHEIFAEHVRRAGIPVRLGVTVTDLQDLPSGVAVTLSDGMNLTGSALIAADGTFSAMRHRLFPEAAHPVYTGQYCWRIVAERPAVVDRALFFMGHGVTCGLMPVSATTMYMWLLEGSPERRRLEDAELPSMLKAMISGFSGPFDAIRHAVAQGTPIIARPLDALLLPRPWHRGRSILIGDAIHATTPHLASGAGLAVEDGMILADMLADNGVSEQTFDHFEARRWERCRLVVEESVAIGHMQQTAASPQSLNERMRKAQAALSLDI